MSGGSFNYLYNRDVTDLLKNGEELQDMQEALKQYEGHEKASEKMERFLKQLDSLRILVSETEELWSDLWPVLRAVEWHYSCDGTKTEVEKELKKQ